MGGEGVEPGWTLPPRLDQPPWPSPPSGGGPKTLSYALTLSQRSGKMFSLKKKSIGPWRDAAISVGLLIGCIANKTEECWVTLCLANYSKDNTVGGQVPLIASKAPTRNEHRGAQCDTSLNEMLANVQCPYQLPGMSNEMTRPSFSARATK